MPPVLRTTIFENVNCHGSPKTLPIIVTKPVVVVQLQLLQWRATDITGGEIWKD